MPSKLRRVRQAADMSQEDVARWLGVHRSLIGHWERGQRTPSAQALRLLQKLFPNADLGFELAPGAPTVRRITA